MKTHSQQQPWVHHDSLLLHPKYLCLSSNLAHITFYLFVCLSHAWVAHRSTVQVHQSAISSVSCFKMNLENIHITDWRNSHHTKVSKSLKTHHWNENLDNMHTTDGRNFGHMKVSGSSETVLRSRICCTIVAQEVEETLSVHRFLNQPKPSSDSESAIEYLCQRLKKLWLYEFFWIQRNHYQIHCKHNHTMRKGNVGGFLYKCCISYIKQAAFANFPLLQTWHHTQKSGLQLLFNCQLFSPMQSVAELSEDYEH